MSIPLTICIPTSCRFSRDCSFECGKLSVLTSSELLSVSQMKLMSRLSFTWGQRSEKLHNGSRSGCQADGKNYKPKAIRLR